MIRRSSTPIGHNLVTISLWLTWILALSLAVAGPVIAFVLATPDPTEPMTRSFDLPSAEHPLGTDRLGRDMLARMLRGNVGLVIPPAIAAVFTTTLGVGLAMLALISTKAHTIIKFLGDVLLAIPAIIIVLAVITAANGDFLAVAMASVLLSVPMSTRYFMATAHPVFTSRFVELA